jgi:hypothetical protein
LEYIAPFMMGGAVAMIAAICTVFGFRWVQTVWESRDLASMGLVVLFVGGGLAALMLKWRRNIK